MDALRFGFNSSAGNAAALGGMIGLDVCRDRKKSRSLIELDVDVVKSLTSNTSSNVERIELEGGHQINFNRSGRFLVHSLFQYDEAAGLQSRALLAAALGSAVFGGKDGGIFAGFAANFERNRGEKQQTLPEAWLRWSGSWSPVKKVALTEKLDTYLNIDDSRDYRFDSEWDVVLQVAARFAVISGVEVKWDHRPAPGYKRMDLTAHTMFVVVWGRNAPPSTSSH